MYIIDSILPFNMVIDTEIGLLRLITFEFRADNIFNIGVLDMSDSELKYLLKHRSHKNPLSVIMKDDKNEELMDDLYNQFMTKEYSKILEMSPSTTLLDLCIKSFYADSIRIDILCKNEEEKHFIKSRINDVKLSLIIQDDNFNLMNYSNIYIKNIDELKRYNKDTIRGKNFYIGDFDYNTEEDPNNKSNRVPILNIVSNNSNNNYYLIDLYSYDQYASMVG